MPTQTLGVRLSWYHIQVKASNIIYHLLSNIKYYVLLNSFWGLVNYITMRCLSGSLKPFFCISKIIVVDRRTKIYTRLIVSKPKGKKVFWIYLYCIYLWLCIYLNLIMHWFVLCHIYVFLGALVTPRLSIKRLWLAFGEVVRFYSKISFR